MRLDKFKKYDCSRYGHAQINNLFRETLAERYGAKREKADAIIRRVADAMTRVNLRLEGDEYRDALLKESAADMSLVTLVGNAK